MGCKLKCIVNPDNNKCCVECEKQKECNLLCDDFDRYGYMEECPDYVKDGESNENN